MCTQQTTLYVHTKDSEFCVCIKQTVNVVCVQNRQIKLYVNITEINDMFVRITDS
jgi:hypothetical protein